MKEKCYSIQIDGWGGFVICEKLKIIKEALKEWHHAHAKNIPGKIKSLKKHQSYLDEKGAEDGLSAE